MTTKKPDPTNPLLLVPMWVHAMLQLVAVIASIFFAFSALDKRLAVIETRMNTSIEQQKTFATQSSLADLERRIYILEQRSAH